MSQFELGLDTFGYHNPIEDHFDMRRADPTRQRLLTATDKLLDDIKELEAPEPPSPERRLGRIVTLTAASTEAFAKTA